MKVYVCVGGGAKEAFVVLFNSKEHKIIQVYEVDKSSAERKKKFCKVNTYSSPQMETPVSGNLP